MVGIEFRFPGGQYHATPWQRHVNEADVEWPPSPWRILRSLIAVWHRKAVYEEFSTETLRNLIDALSSSHPEYALPPAVHTNVRHYMPIGGGGTTLVYDGFLRLDRDAVLVVRWPDVNLNDAETRLLKRLVDKLAYLGRAESWVEANFVDVFRGEANCFPVEQSAKTLVDVDRSAASNDMKEFTKVLVPMSHGEFKKWRENEERTSSKKQSSRSKRFELAEDLLEALSVDTNDLERAGRLQPPGSQWVMYERPVLDEFRGTHAIPAVRDRSERYHAARFAIVHDRLPRLLQTLDVADILHMAILSICGDAVPTIVSGRDAEGNLSVGHRHLYILPEDADADGRLEHITLYSSEPFPPELVNSLLKLRKIWTPLWWSGERREWPLYLEGFSEVRAHDTDGRSQEALPLLQAARVWRTCTPYLHPWHVKRNGRFGPEEQIRRELATRGLPSPVRVERLPAVKVRGREYQTIQFQRYRRSKKMNLPDTLGSFWEIEFAEKVPGPIALGAHCHFGLGLFVPRKS